MQVQFRPYNDTESSSSSDIVAFDSSDDEQVQIVSQKAKKRLIGRVKTTASTITSSSTRKNTPIPASIPTPTATSSSSSTKPKKRLAHFMLVAVPKVAAAAAKRNSNFDNDSDSSSSSDMDVDVDVESHAKKGPLNSNSKFDDADSDYDSDDTFDAKAKATKDCLDHHHLNFSQQTVPTSNAKIRTSTTTTRTRTEKAQSPEDAIVVDDDDYEYENENVNDSPQSKLAAAPAEVSGDAASPGLPTIYFFKKHCWKCHVTLDLTINGNPALCLYALHPHPLLKVPICSVCREEVWAAEQELLGREAAAANSEEEEEEQACSGCGGLEGEENGDTGTCIETLFLCDECPRAFCQQCVAQCHGGGSRGAKQAKDLQASDDKWSCPFCLPPKPLSTLQTYMQKRAEREEGVSKELDRTVETILSELQKVEQERRECDHQLSPAILRQKEAEVRSEMLSMSNIMKDVDIAVQEELEAWQKSWARHDQRLGDRVLSLQEEIESRGESLAAVYAAIQQGNDTDQDQSDSEPEWKKAADAEIQRRHDDEDEADDLTLQNPSDPAVYQMSIPEDVEDLGISDPGENVNKRSKWRHGRRRANLEAFKAALEEEDKMLHDLGIPLSTVDDDAVDLDDGYEELIVRQRPLSALGPRGPRSEPPTKRPRMLSSSIGNTRAPRSAGKNENDDAARGEMSDLSDNASLVTPSMDDGDFENSSFVLSPPDSDRIVSIAEPLATKLKTHQIEGVEFMWKNCFGDLAYTDPSTDVVANVGGCILAHVSTLPVGSCLIVPCSLSFSDVLPFIIRFQNMGLGKSLTCISLLHALLSKRLIKTVLLVTPTNVLAHWQNEIDQWTGNLHSPINMVNIGAMQLSARRQEIHRWKQRGGVLLVSNSMFVVLVKNAEYANSLNDADVVVVDEGHVSSRRDLCAFVSQFRYFILHFLRFFPCKPKLMLRNASQILKALTNVATKRRITLTGSPIQNNLGEYYSMASWVRPAILGHSESAFEKEYAAPIMAGLASDASLLAVQRSEEVGKKLHNLLAPHVQRKDATILRQDLPPMQQAILILRQSKMQSRLYRAFAAYKKQKEITNFFQNYQLVRPIHNHPGTLLLGGGNFATASEPMATTEDATEIVDEVTLAVDSNQASRDLPPMGPSQSTNGEEAWWRTTVERQGGVEKLNEVEQGYKVVLLLHILMEAQSIGDKVLVFSQCLRTLDFLEKVLGLQDWFDHVPGLTLPSKPGIKRGGWKKGCDYLRIDGQTQFSQRGELIDRFNDEGKDDDVKAFLLSSTVSRVIT